MVQIRKIVFLVIFALITQVMYAQNLVLEVDFATRFDNREYSASESGVPQTLFSARVSPRIGIEWEESNRLMFGVDLLQDFGDNTKFLTHARPTMYYQFKSDIVHANAGVFDRKELMGEYSSAFFSDSTVFYNNRIYGFLGRYESSQREKTYIELALNWEGMISEESREMFRIISAGRYTFDKLYMGYAFTMFHFANSLLVQNVSDNVLMNPFVGVEFNAFFDFNIKGGFLIAPQRVRYFEEGWKMPCGGQFDFTISKNGLKLDNRLYLGGNLQPYYHRHDAGFYAGEQFYGTTKGIYNRTWVGYERSFFNDSVSVEAGAVFHYDGSNVSSQQIIKLSVAIGKLINIAPKGGVK